MITGIGLEIWIDYFFPISANCFYIVLAVFIGFTVLLVAADNVGPVKLYRWRIWHGLLVHLALISFAFCYTWWYAAKNHPLHILHTYREGDFIIATLREPPVAKGKIWSAVADVTTIVRDGKTNPASGKILLNIQRTAQSDDIKYGDEIVFRAPITEIEPPKNPEEFSFKLYQSFHNIYQVAYLTDNSWMHTGRYSGNVFLATIYTWREKLLHVIERNVKNTNNLAVASAILLGYRDYMNAEITHAYAASGALHVLSVSGLHVGIVFMMLNFLLRWLDRRGRFAEVVKSVFIITVIWIYACITGLSPSVLRSAVMFTVMQAGVLFVRHTNIYNTLAASAVLLMLFNPYIITEIGFRLSYAAVLGIVYLHPIISSKLLIVDTRVRPKASNWLQKAAVFFQYDLVGLLRYRFPDFIWQLTSVSLAAQIATFPIGLYYFHQFPVMFLVSNWFIIPLSNFILFFGVAMFLTASIPFVANWTGAAFNALVSAANYLIFKVEELPFALIENITISMPEMVLIYLLIFMLCVAYETRSAKALLVSLAVICILSIFNLFDAIKKERQAWMAVYYVPRHSALTLCANREAMTLFDEKLNQDKNILLFRVQHHWWKCGVKHNSSISDAMEIPFGKWISWRGKSIFIVNKDIPKTLAEPTEKLHADFVIVSGNPRLYINTLCKVVQFSLLIIDTSNKPYKVKLWENECTRLGIPYWNVYKQGAYVRDFS
ncbi:MAG: ComEC/Rec2 family competence protein [Chitinophagales bacterium]|nr:ComEC/Rec2 family competence protein [Chitinophagales bacterium]